MKINRNMVANALIITALTVAGGSTATAGTTIKGTSPDSTRTSHSTDYTLCQTNVTGQSQTVNGGTVTGSQ